jgi:hypothetical protein
MHIGFFITEGKGWERVSYRCDSCKIFMVFGPEDKPRVYCCGQWREYVKPTGFFAASLPREQFRAPRVLEVARKSFEEAGTE